MDNLQTSASAESAAGAAPAALDLPLDLTERLRALRDALLTGLVERDVAIRLALLAALAGEHLLLVGPPGTAKSVLARRLHLAFKDASYFERLLTKFSVPEELFGPLSIKGLEEDRYERQTDRYLPTATVAFLDEIFKANSAILNALLTLLNEREFDNGAKRVRTPLVSVVGASNELAEGEELDALFDRFLLRLHVGYVSDDGFLALIDLRGDAVPEVSEELRLGAEDLTAIQAAAPKVTVPRDVVALLQAWRKWCVEQSIEVSDRRWRKVVKLLQVSALTNGRSEVSVWDAWLIQHCLWAEPRQRELVYQWYAERVGASAAMDPGRLTKLVLSWEGRLKRDQESQGQQRDAQGRLLYRTAKGTTTTKTKGPVQAQREGKPLYVAQQNWKDSSGYGFNPNEYTNHGKGYTAEELGNLYAVDGLGRTHRFREWSNRAAYLAAPSSWLSAKGDLHPCMGTTQQKPEYIVASLAQIERVRRDVEAYRVQVVDHLAAMTATIARHLWVMPEFIPPAATTLNATLASVDGLLSRLAHVREAFELLPVEPPDTDLTEDQADEEGEG